MNIDPVFSVIHPTLARPDIAIRRCEEWFSKARTASPIEYVFGVHAFDDKRNIAKLIDFSRTMAGRVKVSITPLAGSAKNWNQAADASAGSLLIQAQDDLVPPVGWDQTLSEILVSYVGEQWAAEPVFIAVSDGHRADRLCITTIVTAVYKKSRGFFLFPEYDGVYADDDSTAQAYQDAEAGRVKFIEARDLVFDHNHYTVSGGMAFDLTYSIENNNNAYKKGAALFARRHPIWHQMQLCKSSPICTRGLVSRA